MAKVKIKWLKTDKAKSLKAGQILVVDSNVAMSVIEQKLAEKVEPNVEPNVEPKKTK